MFRNITIIAVISIALISVVDGCVHLQTDPKKVPASLNLPVPPAPKPRESMNFPEFQHVDEVRAKLEHDSKELTEAGNEFEEIAKKITATNVTIHPGPLDDLIKSLTASAESVHEQATAILEKGPQYLEKIDKLSAAVDTAPQTFTDAAKLFRKFADEEEYADLKQDYVQIAIMFEHMASRTSENNEKLHRRYNRQALLDTLNYIKHQETYLDRLLSVLYTRSCTAADIDAFVLQIQRYIQKFEELRTRIRTINDTFRELNSLTKENQVPPQTDSPSRPSEATTPAPSGTSPTNDTRVQKTN